SISETDYATGKRRPALSPLPAGLAPAPLRGPVEPGVGRFPGVEAVGPMLADLPPRESAVPRLVGSIDPNLAIAVVEFGHGIIGARRRRGGKAERQYADRKSKTLHCQLPVVPFRELSDSTSPILRQVHGTPQRAGSDLNLMVVSAI